MIRRTLPTDPLPLDTVCLQLQIPNDPHYIAAVWGAIFDLTSAIGWENDAAHTALIAARRMRKMYNLAQIGNCPPAVTGPGFFLDECMNIKQDPANPCLLREVCPDGSLGCVIFDASLCMPNPAPGAGITPPGAGGICQDYNILIDTHLVTLMPFVVNSGDTLALDSATGASTDGFNWYCPDGENYLLGGCTGGAHTVPGSPVPTKPFMKLIWKIGANYYDATATPFTVPGGVTNAQVWLQVNNAALTSVGGTEQVKLTFCNNQASTAAWCRKSDFTVTPASWTTFTLIDPNGQTYGPAFWTAGVGWETHPMMPPPSTTFEFLLGLRFDMGVPTPITAVQANGHIFNVSGGTLAAITISASNDPTFTSGVTTLATDSSPTANADFSFGASSLAVTARYLEFRGIGFSITTADDPVMKLKDLTVHGNGTNPFGANNCS